MVRLPGHPGRLRRAAQLIAAALAVCLLALQNAPASSLAQSTTAPATADFQIDPDFSAYVTSRGGVDTFGLPSSNAFMFDGFKIQIFQRRVVQQAPDGGVRLLNLLDPGLLAYTHFNGSTFPDVDAGIVA